MKASVYTPLEDIFPWRCQSQNKAEIEDHIKYGSQTTRQSESVLVADSIESDGKFVLYSLFKNSSNENTSALWLCCSSMTDSLTLAALKKIGASSSLTDDASLLDHTDEPKIQSAPAAESKRLTLRSLPTLLSKLIVTHYASGKGNNKNLEDPPFDRLIFTKSVYKLVKDWFNSNCREHGTPWVVLDDVTALAILLGERLVFGLVQSLHYLSRKYHFCFAIRCANDLSIGKAGLLLPKNGDDLVAECIDDADNYIQWETSLLEFMDIVVDVVPLASGYTREAHGRLIFTELQATVKSTQSIYNYCLTDSQALAIRIVPSRSIR